MIKSLIKPLIIIESKFDGQLGIRDHRYETLIKVQISNSKFKIQNFDPDTQNMWNS